MKNILFALFICSAFWSHAQKNPKNEFSVGYFTIGHFFDSTGWEVSNFIRGEAINLHYSRRIRKHLSLNFNHIFVGFSLF